MINIPGKEDGFAGLTSLVVFQLDDQRYALPIQAVERVVAAAAITVLPDAPAVVMGVIDLEGRVVPVLNIRRRFGLPERDVALTDQFIVAQTARRIVVLTTDQALGVIHRSAGELVAPPDVVRGVGQLQGILRMEDGLVLIHDLDSFLALDEELALDEALKKETAATC